MNRRRKLGSVSFEEYFQKFTVDDNGGFENENRYAKNGIGKTWRTLLVDMIIVFENGTWLFSFVKHRYFTAFLSL